MDRISFTLGGRCAELEFFNEVTTGAQDDLKKAYDVANAIVTKVGMAPSLYNLQFERNEYGIAKHSEKTAEIIDREIQAIILECHRAAREIVAQNREKIEE